MWIFFIVNCYTHTHSDHLGNTRNKEGICEAHHYGTYKTKEACEGFNNDYSTSYSEDKKGFFIKETKILNRGFCFKKQYPVIKKEKFKIIKE